MHPELTNLSGRCPCRLLKLGYLASHEKTCLPLLPSGPDGVQQAIVAQDPTINATCMGQDPTKIGRVPGIQFCYSGLQI